MTRPRAQPQHRPDPDRAARQAAASIIGRQDWWVAARRIKRQMRRAARRDPGASRLWADTRRAFSHYATRSGLASLAEEGTVGG